MDHKREITIGLALLESPMRKTVLGHYQDSRHELRDLAAQLNIPEKEFMSMCGRRMNKW